MKMIIGISGQAGSGKDTVADFLIKNHTFVKVSLADPLKRICKDIFEFSDEQLWGPSEYRNAPDKRYPRGDGFLTPRYALQKLGTEWGRDCYDDIWINYALRTAKILLLNNPEIYYTQQMGIEQSEPGSENYLGHTPCKGVVIPDVRFRNEIEAIKKVGGFVTRVNRPGSGLQGEAKAHRSESEMRGILDNEFDHIIQNVGSLDDLDQATSAMVDMFRYEL